MNTVKHYRRHLFCKCFMLIFTLSLFNIASVQAGDYGNKKVKWTRGVAVTGLNRLLGEPLWDSGTELGPFGFDYVFAYNPEGDEPLELTPDTPLDTVLATGTNPISQAFLGIPPGSTDPALINVPYRQTPIIVQQDGTRAELASVMDVSPFERGLSLPNYPITLGRWLQARGIAKIKCHKDGTSTLTLRLRGLIENGLYTVWSLYAADRDNDGFTDAFTGPTGGVPNTLVADERGRARFRRVLNICPLDNRDLSIIDVTYHTDGAVYGGVASLPFAGLPPGVVAMSHVEFAINTDPLEP